MWKASNSIGGERRAPDVDALCPELVLPGLYNGAIVRDGLDAIGEYFSALVLEGKEKIYVGALFLDGIVEHLLHAIPKPDGDAQDKLFLNEFTRETPRDEELFSIGRLSLSRIRGAGNVGAR
jgi:hypothetical protein